ncbi:MAG: methylated-DNA--[protein]-cysteine S-methyltransferase [Litoreibacter sp.]
MTFLIDSPVGPLSIQEEDGAIVSLEWRRDADEAKSDLARQTANELTAYFSGGLTEFTVPLALPSNFAGKFAQALLNIPFGDTLTYGDLAKKLGVPAQAIGQACGANKIPIIVPCHRVLGANSLGGFSGRGGVEAKVALLKLEGAASLLI